MTRNRIILLVLAALLAFAGLAAWVLGPALIEHAIATRLQAVALARGVDLTWEALAVDAGGVTLRDVRVEHPALSARVPSARVDVSLWAAAQGDLQIDAIAIERPEVLLRASAGAGRAAVGARRSGVRRRLPTELPPIIIEEPRLTVLDGARRPRLVAEAEAIQLEPAASGWALSGAGTAQADGVGRLAGALEGQLDPRQRAAAIAIVGEGGPAVQLRREGVSVQAGRVELVADWADRALAVTLSEVSLAAGPIQAEGIRVSTRVAGLAAPRAFEVRGGVVRLARGAAGRGALVAPAPAGPRLAGLYLPRLRAPSWARQALGARASRPASIDEPTGGPLDRLDPLWPTIEAVELAVEGLTIELPGAPPITEARGGWSDGVLHGEGALGAGRVAVGLSLVPGRPWPEVAAIELDGVELGPVLDDRLGGAVHGWLVLNGLGRAPGGPALRLDGAGHWQAGRVAIDGLADGPVDGIDLWFDGALTRRGDGAAHVGGHIGAGPVTVAVDAALIDPLDDPALALELRGEPVDCGAAWAAIPAALRGPYADARLSGTLAPRVAFDWPVHRPQTLELKIRGLFKACTIESLAARPEGQPPAMVGDGPAPALDDVGWLNARFALPVREGVRRATAVHVGPGADGFVPLVQLPRYVGAAMYQSEEMGFYRNNAVAKGLLTRALRTNLDKGRFVYGGSTVTQQLVKNLFLTRTKTLARKLQELLIATRITQSISRARVLELYLNCIEFGPDVYGIGPAARYYFQKSARALTPREAVYLAMLKPAPRRGGYHKRRGYSPTFPWWVERQEVLMQRLVESGYISAETAEAERPYTLRWSGGRYLGHPGPGAAPGLSDSESPKPAP